MSEPKVWYELECKWSDGGGWRSVDVCPSRESLEDRYSRDHSRRSGYGPMYRIVEKRVTTRVVVDYSNNSTEQRS